MGAAKLSSGSLACPVLNTAVARKSGHETRQLPRTIRAKPATFSLERNVVVQTAIETPPNVLTEHTRENYNWFKHWWPVQLIYNLDTDRPNRLQLLGEYFAAWKNKNGEWVVMKDMCPHRLAPLSEGRVEEDGTLMCSYHGWRFDESGKCVKIPQADDEKSHKAACSNPRSCAMTFPCKARGGILWIWPDHSETRFLDANVTSLGWADEYADYFEDRIKEGYTVGNANDLPYDYNVLVENFLDPSHAPFAHHAAKPSLLRSNGGPTFMKSVEPSSPASIGAYSFLDWAGDYRTFELSDRSLVSYRTSAQEEGHSPYILFLFVIPLENGKSRTIGFDIPQGVLSGHRQPPFLYRLMTKNFPWLLHLLSLGLFDGDTVLLHAQEANTRHRGTGGWDPDLYFTPTAADMSVIRFRKWLGTEAGGGPFGSGGQESISLLPKRKLLDRQVSHVSQCKVCQEALRFVNRTISFCKFISTSFLVLASALVYSSIQYNVFVKWKIGAAAAVAAAFYLFQRFLTNKLLPMFYFVNYIHAEKD